MSRNTPGPWYAKREGYSTVYVKARILGRLIQEVAACGPTDAGQDQQDANARLIAAAPELLEALKAFVADWSDDTGMSGPSYESVRFAREAIAKAEGAE